MMRTTLLPLAFLPLLGCAEPAIDALVTAPLVIPSGGDLSGTELIVPRNRGLALIVQPMGDGETLKHTITLESADASIADVTTTTTMNHFVVAGLSNGTTELEVVDEDGLVAPPVLTVTVTSP